MRKKYKDEVKFQQSLFPVDTSFKNTLFVDTIIIGENLKKIDKSHGRSLNQWVGRLMQINIQIFYDVICLLNTDAIFTFNNFNDGEL